MKRGAGPRIFRVLVPVKNLERSQRFYESLFGTSGRPVGGGRVYFDCGSTIFGLLDPAAEGTEQLRTVPEPVYFATAELEKVHRRAKKLRCLSPARIHGGDPAGEIVVRPWGERSFYAQDPSGNPLCFVDEETLFIGSPRQVRALYRAFQSSVASAPSAKVRRPRTRRRHATPT
jgi:catechol 2,3-dioxygenase-like lactoylglutathione lyase family enzyme